MIPPPPLNEDARKTLLWKRFLAALIDGLIAGLLALLGSLLHERIGLILGGTYILLRDGLSLPFINQRSFGKQLLGLRPISLSGGVMDPKTSARRNWPLALPSFLHAISGGFLSFLLSIAGFAIVLAELAAIATNALGNGHRFGDRMAETEVRSDS